MLWTILGVLAFLTIIFTLALCRVAAQADRWAEDWYNDQKDEDE